jgi:predicted component of viral defense system (DUF524 family)
MQHIEIPKSPVLHGEKAKNALLEYIKELKEQNSKELTEKQTNAFILFAEGLISAIESESCSDTAQKKTKSPTLVKQLKKTFLKYIPGLSQDEKKTFF